MLSNHYDLCSLRMFTAQLNTKERKRCCTAKCISGISKLEWKEMGEWWEREIDRNAGRNAVRDQQRKSQRQTDRHTHTDTHTHTHTQRQTETDRHRERQTERETETKTDRQTDRQKLYKQKQTSVSLQLIIDEIVQLYGIEIGTAILSSWWCSFNIRSGEEEEEQ